jgi:hypothetical protein
MRMLLSRGLLGALALGAVVWAASCAEDPTVDVEAGSTVTVGGGGENTTTTSAGGGMEDPCAGITCPAGEICMNGDCVEGCNVSTDCESGFTCCGGGCVDVSVDMLHCGMCDQPCIMPPNQAASCQMGLCTVGACDPGFFDCDGDAANGCEEMSQCSCTPGDMQSCYPGPTGTENVGICAGGTRKCNSTGTAWSLCTGFILPSPELCSNNIDEDCSGTADDVPDLDGDGWTSCDNDCCETTQDCAAPAKVNPGAFEFVGNGIDDDCDSSSSDTTAAPACSTQADFSAVTAQQMADAMELCQTTSANAPLPTKKWGVVSASFRLANGNTPTGAQLNTMQNSQAAILQNFGTGGVLPLKGTTMAGISSGPMRDANDPGFVAPNDILTGTTNMGVLSTPPAAYLAAHGNQLPGSFGCSGNCPNGSGANDPINLRLQIRVPTNALSFSYKFRFFTAEYWTYSCSLWNDFFLALLTSTAANLPADKNISFDTYLNPVSVNNGFFDVCQPKGCYTCPAGWAPLTGTGMDLDDPQAGGFQRTGGATVWLATTAPIVPGETITFELMVFDVSDQILSSSVLLDDFLWSIDPSGVGTGPPG